MYFCTICHYNFDSIAMNRISSQTKKRGQCKNCVNQKSKEWRTNNLNKVKINNNKYRQNNKDKLNKYHKQYYQNNKQKWTNNYIPNRDKQQVKKYMKEYSKLKYKNYKEWLDDIRNVPCIDCGQTFPAICMDFDHVPERGKKFFNLASGYNKSEKAINEEIAKCDIICSNCHRIRTHIIRKK